MLRKIKLFDLLKNYLSAVRINSYIKLATQYNLKEYKAIHLYRMNLIISKELYSLISNFEVILRNVINKEIIKFYGENWYNKIKWTTKHEKQLNECKDRLKEHKKDFNINNIVSNLQLGFWIYMFSGNYESNLWVHVLSKIFPYKTNRNEITTKLKTILTCRNKISHCENIIKDLDKLLITYNNIIELTNFINKDLIAFLKIDCNFIKTFNKLKKILP